MKRVEIHTATGGVNRQVGMLEYDELRGKKVSSFKLCE